MLEYLAAFDALKPLMALYSMSAEQQTDYVEAIRSSVGWMRPERFAEVAKEATKTAGSRKPVPAAFVAIYERLKPKFQWTDPPPKKCHGCGGDFWVPIWFYNEVYQMAYSASRPCPSCNRSIYSLPDGCQEITREEFEAWRESEKAKTPKLEVNHFRGTTASERLRARTEEAKKNMALSAEDWKAALPPAPPKEEKSDAPEYFS